MCLVTHKPVNSYTIDTSSNASVFDAIGSNVFFCELLLGTKHCVIHRHRHFQTLGGGLDLITTPLSRNVKQME